MIKGLEYPLNCMPQNSTVSLSSGLHRYCTKHKKSPSKLYLEVLN